MVRAWRAVAPRHRITDEVAMLTRSKSVVAAVAAPPAATGPSAPPVPDADALRDLLAAYQRLIDDGGEARRLAPLPRRLVMAGTQGFAVEHVRRALAALDRRYAAHAALVDHPVAGTDESRERVRQLAASLPAPHSRLRVLAWGAGVLVVARTLLAILGEAPPASRRATRVPGRSQTPSAGSVT